MADTRQADPMISLDGLHLDLESAAGPVNILRGIDLEIGRAETVSVVGPSGSGKSSMMMVIAGLERATGGTVTVARHDLGRLDEDALALFRRRHVGIVFQNFHLIATMTALENVAIPLEFAGRSDAFAAARTMLAAVGLDHRETHYPSQLSGGEQQRVALARAFAGEPDLILADEPTGNLDAATGHTIIELMFGLAEARGATLVLITHDPAVAERCQRRLAMLDGRIAEDVAAASTAAVATVAERAAG